MVRRLFPGGRWIRTIGPWRHAVGPVMENVDNLAEPAGRLSQSTTLRGCYVPGSRKREHGLASFVSLWAKPSWRRATARRFFSFGAGPMVRIRLPPPVSQAKLHSDRTRPEPIASFPGIPRSLPTAHSCCTSTMPERTATGRASLDRSDKVVLGRISLGRRLDRWSNTGASSCKVCLTHHADRRKFGG